MGGGLFSLYGSFLGQHLVEGAGKGWVRVRVKGVGGPWGGGQLEPKVCVLASSFLTSAGPDCPSDSDGATMEAAQQQRD